MRKLIIRTVTIPLGESYNMILRSTGFSVEDNGELMGALTPRVHEGVDTRLKVLIAYTIAKQYEYEILFQYCPYDPRPDTHEDNRKLLRDCLDLIQNTYPNPNIINLAKQLTYEI